MCFKVYADDNDPNCILMDIFGLVGCRIDKYTAGVMGRKLIDISDEWSINRCIDWLRDHCDVDVAYTGGVVTYIICKIYGTAHSFSAGNYGITMVEEKEARVIVAKVARALKIACPMFNMCSGVNCCNSANINDLYSEGE